MEYNDYFYNNKKNRLFDCHFYEHNTLAGQFYAIVDHNWSPGEQQTLYSVSELMEGE